MNDCVKLSKRFGEWMAIMPISVQRMFQNLWLG
jgi:hypothetical protein